MKKKEIRIVFEPSGKQVVVGPGKSILEAASKAGVSIRSECGGRGLCGKCKVIIPSKTGLSPLTKNEKSRLTAKEIEKGFRLACLSLVTGEAENVTVIIPEESRLEKRRILIEGFERDVSLEPAIYKVFLEVPKPSLGDVRADAERLLNVLGEKLEISLEVLRKLPTVLRDGNWRVSVTIWNNQRIIDIEAGRSDESYGVAVDLGTSKIIGYLVDLSNGDIIRTATIENPQLVYGEDLVTRISLTIEEKEKLQELHNVLIEGINTIIEELCKKASINPNRIYEMTVVGNTAMHHFFMAIPPKNLALYPYVPAVKYPINIQAKKLNVKLNPSANIHVLPVIAGFVGADAVGDVLATGIYESEKTQLLIDIGTNTEIILGNKKWLIACSCASGPAFEGMHIKHGMKAVSGAIERVWINPKTYEVKYKTIDNKKPIGICGSAMIDILAELWKAKIIDFRGKFKSRINTPRYREINNKPEFVIAWRHETALNEDIVVTQDDIHEIQLAKAAIHTGCAILMKRKNIKKKQIDKILIAGTFGNYLDPVNSKIVGLIPDIPTGKIKFVGNTAGLGAKVVLISKEMRRKAEEISKKTEYLELAADPDFKVEFAHSIYIPHKNIDNFPTAKKYV